MRVFKSAKRNHSIGSLCLANISRESCRSVSIVFIKLLVSIICECVIAEYTNIGDKGEVLPQYFGMKSLYNLLKKHKVCGNIGAVGCDVLSAYCVSK